ncbi:MAG: LysM peptidoglycan-binding domain-containing protein [Bacteroidia bacterium]
MKKLFSLALLLVLMGSLSPAKAQNQNLPDDVQQSGDILKNLDSLMKLWYLKNTTYNKAKKSENIYGYRADEVPTFSDSVYSSRIEKINSPLPYVYNDKVKGFINLYAVRKRQQVEKMLGLSEFYFPIYEEVLDKYNMPLEIKYLSVVESALNPRAVSRVGATGLWQFMYTTGIMYKLNVDSYVDDRKDPYESTEAAALFLKDLHNLFGDWFLAIAAYNCGPGNVNKAIRRSGGKRTFWEIYPYLPQETRGYVPAFIAVSYVFQYHREHNLYPQTVNLPKMVDTVLVDKEVDFKAIASVLDVEMEMLRDLNPQYKKDVVPARNKPLFLRLPATKAYVFGGLKDSICSVYALACAPKQPAEKKAVANPNDTNIKDQQIAQTQKGNKPDEKDEDNTNYSKVKIRYTVKAGDNLGLVADWFDVSIYSLRRWNGLRGNKIAVGQRLNVMVPAEKKSYYAKINTMSKVQKSRLGKQHIAEPDAEETKVASKKPTETKTQKTPARKPAASNQKIQYYVVQRGDTLWSIAQRFPGVTVEEIKRLNGIRDNRSLQLGQKLKIQKS